MSINLFSSHSNTNRFEKYKLHEVRKEVNEGEKLSYFIVPVDDSKLQKPQSAFEHYPHIISDFMETCRIILEKSEGYFGKENYDTANEVLRFCNKYGLLNMSGFYMDNFYMAKDIVLDDYDSYSAYDVPVVALNESGFLALGEQTIDIFTYANHFMPKEWKDYKDLVESAIKSLGGKDDKMKKLANALSYNYYCESVNYAIREMLQLYYSLLEWYKFMDSGKDPFDTYKSKHYYKDILSEHLEVKSIDVSLDYNGKWQLKWLYKSLIDAINIMFLMNKTETKQSVRLCKNCSIAFIAGKESQQYCNPSCNNAARQRRFQERKRKAH